MQFIVKKCTFITFTKKKVSLNYHYTIRNEELPRVTRMRDLGIPLHHSLSYEEQISVEINNSLRTICFVARNSSKFRSPFALKLLYFLLVRPILEYASVIWAPLYMVHKIRLERVPNCVLRFAARQIRMPMNKQDYDYSGIRTLLNIKK